MLQISEQNAQALLNYLASKPYQEVYEAIKMLQSLQPIEQVMKGDEESVL